MSSIGPIESLHEAAPLRYDEKREDFEAVEAHAEEQKLTPAVHAKQQERAERMTLNGFQYTGTGSFIDKIF